MPSGIVDPQGRNLPVHDVDGAVGAHGQGNDSPEDVLLGAVEHSDGDLGYQLGRIPPDAPGDGPNHDGVAQWCRRWLPNPTPPIPVPRRCKQTLKMLAEESTARIEAGAFRMGWLPFGIHGCRYLGLSGSLDAAGGGRVGSVLGRLYAPGLSDPR